MIRIFVYLEYILIFYLVGKEKVMCELYYFFC